MKRVFCVLLACMMASLSACGSDGGRTNQSQNSVNAVLEEQMEKADAGEAAAEADQESSASTENAQEAGQETGETGETAAAADDTDGRFSETAENAPAPEATDPSALLSTTPGIDIDLTMLSSTMVYSEVYNMMMTPDDYLGKTVKMNGSFSVYHDEAADVYYFACIIADATACCSQGIEFVLAGDYSYPEDYPELGEEITVTGVFDTYIEGEYQYCTLRNASML